MLQMCTSEAHSGEHRLLSGDLTQLSVVYMSAFPGVRVVKQPLCGRQNAKDVLELRLIFLLVKSAPGFQQLIHQLGPGALTTSEVYDE